MPKLLPAIVIHGGAWAIPDKIADASQDGVKEAARIGYKILMEGGSAVDAVESAVASLEDNPVFDAGKIAFYWNKYYTKYHAILYKIYSLPD